jgi:hypothetical protein
MRRTGHETLRKQELRLARVSLGIVLLYMVCHSPKLVPTLCEIVYGDAKVGKQRSQMVFHNFLSHLFKKKFWLQFRPRILDSA